MTAEDTLPRSGSPAPGADLPAPGAGGGMAAPPRAALPVHAGGGPTPPEAPLDMPTQDFRAAPPRGPARLRPMREVMLARIIAFGGGALITALGFWQMWLVLSGSLQALQYVLLVLFSITFGFSPSMIATQELVVPRSMPMIFAMLFSRKNSLFARCGSAAAFQAGGLRRKRSR